MKKDKKKTPTPLWRQWNQSPYFSNNFYIYVIFFFIFILAVILAWKQYKEAPPRQEAVLSTEIQPPSNNEKPISERAITIEVQRKLIALELFRGVLDGMIPLETLKTFLQKTPEPWANGLLLKISSLKEGITYSQLETLLVFIPSEPVSTWQHIKSSLNSLIHIRKLNGKNGATQGQLKDIRKALRAHDIQKAIKIFETLSLGEKTQLSSWKQFAQERLLLELSMQSFLLELADK